MKKFDNFKSNLAVLERAKYEDLDNEFISSGVINKFFIQFELGWKVLKELLRYEGVAGAMSGSPRAIIKAAYAMYDFIDEDIWLGMLRERNDTAHIYDGEAAKKLVYRIVNEYISEFEKMRDSISQKYDTENL